MTNKTESRTKDHLPIFDDITDALDKEDVSLRTRSWINRLLDYIYSGERFTYRLGRVIDDLRIEVKELKEKIEILENKDE